MKKQLLPAEKRDTSPPEAACFRPGMSMKKTADREPLKRNKNAKNRKIKINQLENRNLRLIFLQKNVLQFREMCVIFVGVLRGKAFVKRQAVFKNFEHPPLL